MKKKVPNTVENKKTMERKNNFPAGGFRDMLEKDITLQIWPISNTQFILYII